MFLKRAGAAPNGPWHLAHGTVMCEPLSGYRVFSWKLTSASVFFMTSQPSVTWQLSQALPNLPLWKSTWQSTQPANCRPLSFSTVRFTGAGKASAGVVVSGCDRWHFSHLTLRCLPVSANCALAWSKPGAGFQLDSLWHFSQVGPSCPRCSSKWQALQGVSRPRYVAALGSRASSAFTPSSLMRRLSWHELHLACA